MTTQTTGNEGAAVHKTSPRMLSYKTGPAQMQPERTWENDRLENNSFEGFGRTGSVSESDTGLVHSLSEDTGVFSLSGTESLLGKQEKVSEQAFCR